jgi:hypothetical protein
MYSDDPFVSFSHQKKILLLTYHISVAKRTFIILSFVDLIQAIRHRLAPLPHHEIFLPYYSIRCEIARRQVLLCKIINYRFTTVIK